MDPAWCLVSLRQGTRTLEGYLITNGPRGSFVELLDFALLTVGSRFTVGVAEDSDTAVNHVMAATSKNTHKMAATTTSHHIFTDRPEPRLVSFDRPEPRPVSADRPEPRPVSADRPDPRHVSADHPEPRHVFVDRPEPSQVPAERPESRHVSGFFREWRRLRSSMNDPPLTTARAAGMPKPPPAASVSSSPVATHSSSPVATHSSSPVATGCDALKFAGCDALKFAGCDALKFAGCDALKFAGCDALKFAGCDALKFAGCDALKFAGCDALKFAGCDALKFAGCDAMDKMAALPVPTGKMAAPSVLMDVGGVPAIESDPEPAPTGEPSPHPRKRRRRRKKASSVLQGSEAFQEPAVGLETTPEAVAPTPSPPLSTTSAVERLIGLFQIGRSLERYVEEFVELTYLSDWSDARLIALFLDGLDEDTIRFCEPDDYVSLTDSINLVLYLNGSKFFVQEVQDVKCPSRPVLPETRAAWPVCQAPSSSSYPSSEFFPCVLPDPPFSAGAGKPKRRRRKKAAPALSEPAAPALSEPAASVLSEPAPVPVGILIIFEGMDWTSLPASPVSAAEPASPVSAAEPAAPVSAAEPSAPVSAAEPSAPVSAAEPSAPVSAAEPSAPVSAAEPSAPVSAAEPAEPAAPCSSTHKSTMFLVLLIIILNLPKYFLGGGQVPVGGEHVRTTHVGRASPWPAQAPDPAPA
ncbi:Glucose-dependent insulinotropic receptor [Anabarilius grahami]|uniref:Glucose-dependent insulinotropic receptor n=1 Tax=Anabarilius grahami TaxID=495550 RepID=A0A3N0ZB39_ANAGA|nr:Glucose-dependent insulinotropic receptor [Anabarilius grahami]